MQQIVKTKPGLRKAFLWAVRPVTRLWEFAYKPAEDSHFIAVGATLMGAIFGTYLVADMFLFHQNHPMSVELLMLSAGNIAGAASVNWGMRGLCKVFELADRSMSKTMNVVKRGAHPVYTSPRPAPSMM